jgi:hypothetical protein
MKIENLTVKTVKRDKLIEFLAIPLNENEELNIDNFAVYEKMYGIDIDCCFWDIHDAMFDNKIQPVIDIECRIRKYNEEGGYSIRMDRADFVKTISLDDYFKIAEEVKLIDFIRFNYNPRITSNQKLLIQYIRQCTSLA